MLEKIKKENFIILISVIFIFSLLVINQNNLSGLVVKASDFGTEVPAEFFATPNSQEIIKGNTGKVTVNINGDFILPYIVIYTRNDGWKKYNLNGITSNEDSNFLSTKASADLIVSQENNFDKNNIVLGYTCNKKNEILDCHGDNYIATSFNLEFKDPPAPQTGPSQPAQASQPSSPSTGYNPLKPTSPVTVTTTNTQCPINPGWCPMKGPFNAVFTPLSQSVKCVLLKKYSPSTGQVYTGSSPGICQGEAYVSNAQLNLAGSNYYSPFQSGSFKKYITCVCEPGNYISGSSWVGRLK
jgi:hypothetical protein